METIAPLENSNPTGDDTNVSMHVGRARRERAPQNFSEFSDDESDSDSDTPTRGRGGRQSTRSNANVNQQPSTPGHPSAGMSVGTTASGAVRIGPSLIPPPFTAFRGPLVTDDFLPPLATPRNLVAFNINGVAPTLVGLAPPTLRPVAVTCVEDKLLYVVSANAVSHRRATLLQQYHQRLQNPAASAVPVPDFKDSHGRIIRKVIRKVPRLKAEKLDVSQIKKEEAISADPNTATTSTSTGVKIEDGVETSTGVKTEPDMDALTQDLIEYDHVEDFEFIEDPSLMGAIPDFMEIESYNTRLRIMHESLLDIERRQLQQQFHFLLTNWSRTDIISSYNTFGVPRGGGSALDALAASHDDKIRSTLHTNAASLAISIPPGSVYANPTSSGPISWVRGPDGVNPIVRDPETIDQSAVLLSHAHRTVEPWAFPSVGLQPFTLATYTTLFDGGDAWTLYETIALLDFTVQNGTSAWDLIVNDPVLRVRHSPEDSEARYFGLVSLSAVYGREPLRLYMNTIMQQNIDVPICFPPALPGTSGLPLARVQARYAKSMSKAAANANNFGLGESRNVGGIGTVSNHQTGYDAPRKAKLMSTPTSLALSHSGTKSDLPSQQTNQATSTHVSLQARLPGQAPPPLVPFGSAATSAKKGGKRSGKSVFAGKNEDEEYFVSAKQATRTLAERRSKKKDMSDADSDSASDAESPSGSGSESGSDEEREKASEGKPAYRVEKILATKRALRRVKIRLDGVPVKFLSLEEAIAADNESRENRDKAKNGNGDVSDEDRDWMVTEMISMAGDILSDGDDFTIGGEYPEVAIHYEQEPDSTAEDFDYEKFENFSEERRAAYLQAREDRRILRQTEKQKQRAIESAEKTRIAAEKKERDDRKRCAELGISYPPPEDLDLTTGRSKAELAREKAEKEEAARLAKEKRESDIAKAEKEESENLAKNQAQSQSQAMTDANTSAPGEEETVFFHRRGLLAASTTNSSNVDGLPRALIHVYLIKDTGFSYARARWFSELGMQKRYGVRATADRIKRYLIKHDEIELHNLEKYGGEPFDPRYIDIDRVLAYRLHVMTTETMKAERRTPTQLNAWTVPPGWSLKFYEEGANCTVFFKRPASMSLGEDLDGTSYENPKGMSDAEVDASTAAGDLHPQLQWSTPSHHLSYVVPMYLVKWAGLGYGQATWEYSTEVKDTMKIAQFRRFSLIPSRDKLVERQYSDHELVVRRMRSQRWYDASPQFRAGHTLRDYQIEGINWLIHCYHNSRNGILADEMGLGKTVQCVAFLEHLRREEGIRGPFMIVAPLSTLSHWKREAEGWTDMNTLVYHDAYSGAHGREVLREYEFFYPGTDIVKFNILITSYEMLLADLPELENIMWKYVIIDEGHRLKNKTAKLMDAFAQLNIPRRLLLTGTPIQNNTTELWTLLNFVEPSKFQSVKDFQRRFKELEEASQVEQLQNTIKPYILRRMKDTVEKSIPPKEETVIDVELTTLQKKYYRAIYERNSKFLRQGLSASTAPKLINIESELRKVCNHPWLVAGTEFKEVPPECTDEEYFNLTIQASGKLVLLDKLLPKLFADGHRVLIFSQMVMLLDILQEYLRYRQYKFERLDGSVTGDQREAAIDRFCRPGSDRFVFLLSTRAGGVGLNLTSADTVIIFDSDWNPQMDVQAQARAHRIGQKSAVSVYRLVTRKTYESQMFAIASKKLGLDHAVLRKLESGAEINDEDPDKLGKILKLGAYGLLDDEEDEQRKTFFNEDIDQILIKNTHVISNKKTDSSKEMDFSSASAASASASGSAMSGKADDGDTDEADIASPRRVGRPPKKNTASVGGLVYSKQYFSSENSESSQIDINDPAFWSRVLGNSADFRYTPDALLSRLTDGSTETEEARDEFFTDLTEGIDRLFKKPVLEDTSQLDSHDEWIQLLIQFSAMKFTDRQRKEAQRWLEEIEMRSQRRSRTFAYSNHSDLKHGRKRRRRGTESDESSEEDEDDDDEGYGDDGTPRKRRSRLAKRPPPPEDGPPRRRGRPPNPNSLKNQRKLAQQLAIQNGEVLRRKRGSKPQHNALICHACHLPGALVPCDGICNRLWHEGCIPTMPPRPLTKGCEPVRFVEPVQPPQCILQGLATSSTDAMETIDGPAIPAEKPDYTDRSGHWQCVECVNRTWRCFGCAYTAKMSIEDEDENDDDDVEGEAEAELETEPVDTDPIDTDPSMADEDKAAASKKKLTNFADTSDPVILSLKHYAKAVRVCSVANCGRVAHLECAKRVPSSRFYGKGSIQKAFRCGAHFCSVCSAAEKGEEEKDEKDEKDEKEAEDDEEEEPEDGEIDGDDEKAKKRDGRKENTLLTCISCPTAFHIRCLPPRGIIRLAKRIIYCPTCADAVLSARSNVGRTAIGAAEKLIDGKLLRERRKLPKNIKNALSKQTREERKVRRAEQAAERKAILLAKKEERERTKAEGKGDVRAAPLRKKRRGNDAMRDGEDGENDDLTEDDLTEDEDENSQQSKRRAGKDDEGTDDDDVRRKKKRAPTASRAGAPSRPMMGVSVPSSFSSGTQPTISSFTLTLNSANPEKKQFIGGEKK